MQLYWVQVYQSAQWRLINAHRIHASPLISGNNSHYVVTGSRFTYEILCVFTKRHLRVGDLHEITAIFIPVQMGWHLCPVWSETMLVSAHFCLSFMITNRCPLRHARWQLLAYHCRRWYGVFGSSVSSGNNCLCAVIFFLLAFCTLHWVTTSLLERFLQCGSCYTFLKVAVLLIIVLTLKHIIYGSFFFLPFV